MPNQPMYVLFAVSLLSQITPAEETLIAVARIFSDYHQRVTNLSIGPFNPDQRRHLTNEAGNVLLAELQQLLDTELPDVLARIPELPMP